METNHDCALKFECKDGADLLTVWCYALNSIYIGTMVQLIVLNSFESHDVKMSEKWCSERKLSPGQ